MSNRESIYNTVDPENGNIYSDGPLELTKGDHSHMTARTDAYLPDQNEPKSGMYDRGHVTASSLSPYAGNGKSNIAPMHSDLNRAGGGYYAMEQGERTALRNGHAINSSKAAIVNGQPGDKPEVFMVSDNVTYSDGRTESVHHSFANASYVEQQAWNDLSASLPDTFDGPNPGDGLRDSMSTSEYADLMERTDAELPGIAADYAEADFSGVPGAESASEDVSADTAAAVDVGMDNDGSADCDVDD